jgi:hypothetical protein
MRDRTAFRHLGPLPGQVELALAQVRDRRRRSAWAAASSFTVVVLLACVASTWRADLDIGLDPSNPGVARTATAVPSSRGPEGETLRAAGPRLATPSALPGPGLSGGALSYSAVASRRSAAVLAPLTPSPTRPSHRPRQRLFTEGKNSATNPIGPEAWPGQACLSARWCADQSYRETNDGLLFANLVCPPSRTGGAIYFKDDRDMDLTLTTADGDDVLWRWSDGQVFPARKHEMYIGQGTCVAWQVRWDGILDDGTPLPPGRYTMVMRMYGDVAVPDGSVTFDVA